MKKFNRFIVLSVGLSFGVLAQAGEIDNSKITTFSSGTVISSSAVNNSVDEVVSQINDNASRIAALEAMLTPADYSGISSRLTGIYDGVFMANEFSSDEGNSGVDPKIGAISARVKLNITDGAGTLEFNKSRTMYYHLKEANEALAIDDETGVYTVSISLTVDEQGEVTTDSGASLKAMKGYINKAGTAITLMLHDKDIEATWIRGAFILNKQ